MNIINIYENYNERDREPKNQFLVPSERIKTIEDCYNCYFSKEFKSIFELCSKIAAKNGYNLYLIGGLVRDMLLNRKSLDIDITVEGNAIEFARILEREKKAKIISVHKDFGTVKVQFDGEKIDFASTRSETYPKKGHLPHVAQIGCSLEKDVIRRDFTINSLAMSLNQSSFADLFDYVGGFEDLKAKKIRILHDKSFIDDPTRIIRALKYSTRLGFELDEKTFKLQQDYLININYDMCNKRVKNEIKKTFEQNSQEAFDRFIDEKIYKLIIKNEIKIPKENVQILIDKYNPKHPWLVYFGLISINESKNFFDKLELTKAEKQIISDAQELIKCSLKDDFVIYTSFNKVKLETLLILALSGKEKEVFHYLNDLQKIKLHISGKDLLAQGISPSKAYGEALNYVLKEKLKTPKIGKAQELELIKAYMQKQGG